jgi:hypothetical protein
MQRIRPLACALAAIVMAATLASCKTTGGGPALDQLAKERLGVSILTVNLLDILNLPEAPDGTNWMDRYSHVGEWIQSSGKVPDLIALQEAPGWWKCTLDQRRLPDYAAIDFLLDSVRDATGEQYRIAYLVVGKTGGTQASGWVHADPASGCEQQSGRALLYRPSRMRNVIVSAPAGATVAVPATPYPRYSPFVARSLPCCTPAATRADVCELIDGAVSTMPLEDGPTSCATREGLAWTRVRRSMEGADPEKPQMDAVFSRFELLAEPGSYIHVFNVHRGFTDDPRDLRQGVPGVFNIDELVDAMEARYNAGTSPNLYPPIVVGDINFGKDNNPPPVTEVEGAMPRYRWAAWSPENVGVVVGRSEIFRAKQNTYANQVEVMPPTNPGEACYRDPATLWSDHCGFFFRIEPSP